MLTSHCTAFTLLPPLDNEPSQLREFRRSSSLREIRIISGIASHINPVFADGTLWMRLGMVHLTLRPKLVIKDMLCAGWYDRFNGEIAISLEFERGESEYASTMIHEMGHGIDNGYRLTALELLRDDPFRIKYHAWRQSWGRVFVNGGQVTEYAKTNILEDIAESYRCFAMQPDFLLKQSPLRYQLCLEGLEALVPEFKELQLKHEQAEQSLSAEQRARHRFYLWFNKVRVGKSQSY